MMDFLREHSTILLALFTVIVAFGGTWLGAHVQASGGIAQAKAAKEAAGTAAAATLQAVREQTDRTAAAAHAAALRDQRTSAITNLLRAFREFARTVNQLYTEPDTAPVDSARNDLLHAWGVVQLIAPTALTAATNRAIETARRLDDLARERGEAQRARKHMAAIGAPRLAYGDIDRARAALAAFRAAWEANDDNHLELHGEAFEALSRIPELTSRQQAVLVIDCMTPELGPVLTACRQEHKEAMDEFITQARAILGVTD
ncbi:hypothetical protein ACH4U5_31325 [Streptomyces sp. NPDC020858]|uniref:hypothetical protein n=1 Tax=Streptomyces sp. NPDC020858 TaxID=3365097 RepID=UPI0037911CEB